LHAAAHVQVRRLTFSEARKLPILEFRLPDILAGLELTMPQFVDLCILCGCDYTDTIRGIGPKTALKLIKTHGTIESVIESLDKTKHPLPDSFDFAQVHSRAPEAPRA
jgi:flap endonuclease-1